MMTGVQEDLHRPTEGAGWVGDAEALTELPQNLSNLEAL